MATKRNNLTIRVPEDLKHRLERVATLQGVDKKTMIREIDRILDSVPGRYRATSGSTRLISAPTVRSAPHRSTARRAFTRNAATFRKRRGTRAHGRGSRPARCHEARRALQG